VRQIDRYTCEETFRRFDDYLDRTLTPGEMELFQEHLEHCERCTREVNFEASILREVRAKLARIDLPADLLSKVSRALDEAEGPEGKQASDQAG
jgi:anti-sigma factor (TIGR02949 family)